MSDPTRVTAPMEWECYREGRQWQSDQDWYIYQDSGDEFEVWMDGGCVAPGLATLDAAQAMAQRLQDVLDGADVVWRNDG